MDNKKTTPKKKIQTAEGWKRKQIKTAKKESKPKSSGNATLQK